MRIGMAQRGQALTDPRAAGTYLDDVEALSCRQCGEGSLETLIKLHTQPLPASIANSCLE